MNGAFAILVVAERLQWQRLQSRILFGEQSVAGVNNLARRMVRARGDELGVILAPLSMMRAAQGSTD